MKAYDSLYETKKSISVTFPTISLFGGGGNLGHYCYALLFLNTNKIIICPNYYDFLPWKIFY